MDTGKCKYLISKNVSKSILSDVNQFIVSSNLNAKHRTNVLANITIYSYAFASTGIFLHVRELIYLYQWHKPRFTGQV